MGERLLRYVQYIIDEQGLNGKVKLAQETLLPSNKAALAPDSAENLARFREAVKKLTGKSAPEF